MNTSRKQHAARRRDVDQAHNREPRRRPATRHRTVDTLGRMLEAGTITPAMHDAGCAFHEVFMLAQFDPLRVPGYGRVLGDGRLPEPSERQLDAGRRVHETLAVLGGMGSPGGSCLWHVVGLQRSLRQWALEQGWNGRTVRQEQAQGILVAALGVLAAQATQARRSQVRRAC